jgi:DNA-binding NarL/FixJ family response regulator
MRIVIADDSDLIRERLRNALTGIKSIKIVGEAKNGLEAMRLLEEENPDFLILDLRMPEMNGIAVLIKGKKQVPGCKFFIFTGYSEKVYKEKCLSEGADYFFDKNREFGVLIKTFNEIANTVKVA